MANRRINRKDLVAMVVWCRLCCDRRPFPKLLLESDSRISGSTGAGEVDFNLHFFVDDRFVHEGIRRRLSRC